MVTILSCYLNGMKFKACGWLISKFDKTKKKKEKLWTSIIVGKWKQFVQ